MEKLTAPKIDGYLKRLGDVQYQRIGHVFTYDEQSYRIIDEIFDTLKRIKPADDDGDWHILWLHAERGPIEDYGDYEEWLAEDMVKDREDFNKSWLSFYPNETKWYRFGAVERKDTGYRRNLVRLAFSCVYRPNVKPLRRQCHRIWDHNPYLGVCLGRDI